MTYQERHERRNGVGGWSRTRWLVVAGVVTAVAVAVLLLVFMHGGASGAGGGGGGGGSWG